MFTQNLYTIVHNSINHNSPNVEQLKCPSVDKWINKTWYILAVEYCPAIKRNEALIRASTWMNLENITLNERSQMQKANDCVILFI